MSLKRLVTRKGFGGLLLCIVCDLVLSFFLLKRTGLGAVPLPETFFWEFVLCFVVCLLINIFLLKKCSSHILNSNVTDLIHDLVAYFMTTVIAVNVFSACADGVVLKSDKIKLLEYVLVFSVLCLQCAIEYKVAANDDTNANISCSKDNTKAKIMRGWGTLLMLIGINIVLLLLVGKSIGWFDTSTTIAGCKALKSFSPLRINWVANLVGLVVFAIFSLLVDWVIVKGCKSVTAIKARLNVIVNGIISCIGYLVIICITFSAINGLRVTIDSAMYEQAYYLLMLFFSIKVALTLSK